MGPAVSWLEEIGMMPLRETRPMVGLIPTRPLALEGQTMEPSVSDPTATTAMPAAMGATGGDGGSGAGARSAGVAVEGVRIFRLAAAAAPAGGGAGRAEVRPFAQ